MPHNQNTNDADIKVRTLERSDIPNIAESFQKANWHKPKSLFEEYWHEQQEGKRAVWIALFSEKIAGYITLVWQSKYKPFLKSKIPEIMDLNVLPDYRNLGTGSKLLETAELLAQSKCNSVGLGVGLYAGKDGGYGAAQKLYVKAGYIPDGNGLTYDYKPVIPGDSYPVDDDLILWLIKK